jgi:hypothetical protein
LRDARQRNPNRAEELKTAMIRTVGEQTIEQVTIVPLSECIGKGW